MRPLIITDALVDTINSIHSGPKPANVVSKHDQDRTGKILYPSTTGPWVVLPHGSLLTVVEDEKNETLTAVLSCDGAPSSLRADAMLVGAR